MMQRIWNMMFAIVSLQSCAEVVDYFYLNARVSNKSGISVDIMNQVYFGEFKELYGGRGNGLIYWPIADLNHGMVDTFDTWIPSQNGSELELVVSETLANASLDGSNYTTGHLKNKSEIVGVVKCKVSGYLWSGLDCQTEGKISAYLNKTEREGLFDLDIQVLGEPENEYIEETQSNE